uniref:Reverse transcriptase domain-containing protein n=1 Tax=Dendroctonus ponderosae TaxID=77166 RepID=A0AAR5PEG8_DENPD
MATWKQDEIHTLREFIQGRTVIGKRDLEEAHELLPGRSVAAIKKKCVELKNHPETNRRPGSSKWEPSELNHLIRAYKSRTETLATARIRAICDDFPGRSQKAIAAKLRETCPDVYYMRDAGPQEQPEDVAEENASREPITLLDREDRAHSDHQNAAESGHSVDHAEPGSNGYEGDVQPPMPRTPQYVKQEPLYSKTKASFVKLLGRVGDRKPKIKKFLIRPQNGETVRLVDAILEEKILEIRTETAKTELEKRKLIKTAIYVATRVLRDALVKNKPVRQAHKRTEDQMSKLRSRIASAKEIRGLHGQALPKQLFKQARIIRRLKMPIKDYIGSMEEKLAILTKKLDRQKTRDAASALRRRFYERPNMDVLRERSGFGRDMRPEDAEAFYRGLYRQSKSDDRTPVFTEWLGKMRKFTQQQNLQHQTSSEHIRRKCVEALARAAPWKAPGEDGIPYYSYKILPAANRYLIDSTEKILTGSQKLTEKDVRARLVLIHKNGDQLNPENYRPISILNTDYKTVTAVITATLTESLPDWAVPPEQFAQPNIWATTHGLLEDKSITTLARKRNTTNYSAWYDFRKAFDSVHHSALKRLIDALPLHRNIRAATKLAIKLWSLRIQTGNKRTAPIPVRRGVLQGDSMSPLLFTLMTAALISHVNCSPKIVKQSRGKHRILAYMDDIKCHAPTKSSLKTITIELIKAAGEIGLELNMAKCGHYTRTTGAGDGDGDLEPFLPRVRQGYKYLGLVQLEKDTEDNYSRIEEQMSERLGLVLGSQLASAQKVALMNSSVIPAVTYVTANVFSDEKRSTTLKRCRQLDKTIRKMLVEHKLKGKSSSNAAVYLPVNIGGLGLNSIEHITEVNYAKKGIYLLRHPKLDKCRERYRALQKAGWRNPITDMEWVLQKYEVDVPEEEDIKKCCHWVSDQIKQRMLRQLQGDWSENMHYGRLTARETAQLTIPANASPCLDTWRRTMLLNAAEEQLHGLCVGMERWKCRRGCRAEETSYHVAAACVEGAYTSRHDCVVHWLLKTLFCSLRAPKSCCRRLQFGRANCHEEFRCGQRQITIKAGKKILTDTPLYHNKPDVVVSLTNPDHIFVIEVAVSHLQNIRSQEKLKKTRYTVNSVIKTDGFDVRNITRDFNLVDELKLIHRCPVTFATFVVGCYGEILATEDFLHFRDVMTSLRVTAREWQILLNRTSHSVAVSTTNILLGRIEGQHRV